MGRMSRRAGLSLLLGLSGVACTAPRPAPNIADADPTVKIAGIKQAVARKDRAALPALVEQLDSDDPAVRLFALQALERFSGDRFGYEYYLDEQQRRPSLARWQEWLKQQQREAPASLGK
ncbi:MAG: hypothetical protein JWN40_3441 [Phycisphaerales bacterium]|jgi:hypothetical protein|nr:hypothetical protein [Phycisphaerales bacterium]